MSTAFDMPTLMGYDSDHVRSEGEVGREGVAVDSLEDMQTLFGGIPLGAVAPSMPTHSPAPNPPPFSPLLREAPACGVVHRAWVDRRLSMGGAAGGILSGDVLPDTSAPGKI